jgi:hypothetical protein
MADFSGGLFRWVILAHLFGGLSWPVKNSGFLEEKKRKK